MKRVLSIMLVLTISWTTFFIFGSEAFASGQLVTTKPTPTTPVNESIIKSEYYLMWCEELAESVFPNGKEALYSSRDAELFYFFTVLVSDKYTVSSGSYHYPDGRVVSGTAYPIRAKSGDVYLNAFNADYLHAYFDIFKLSINDTSEEAVNCCKTFYSKYIGCPNTNAAVAHTSKNYPFGYSYEGFSNYYNSLYAEYLVEHNESGTSVGYENTNSDDYVQPIKIPSEYFVNAVNNNTTSLTTSIPTNSISWKNNPLSVSGYDGIRTEQHLAMMIAGNWFGASKDLYAMPFVVKDGVTYYGDSVYHFYYGDFTYSVKSGSDYVEYSVTNNPIIDKYSSFSSTGDAVNTFYLMPSANSVYSKLSWSETYLVPAGVSDGIYGFLTGDKTFYFTGLNSRTNSQTLYNYYHKDDTGLLNSFSGYREFFNSFYNSSNVAESLTWSSLKSIPATDTFKSTTIPDCMKSTSSSPYAVRTSSGNFTLSVDDVPYDYGFLIAPKRFEIGTLMSYLDGSRIPQDSYITINNGDSVYDYSITNSTTGDTTNLGDFINHGYAWLNTGSGTQNNQGSGSGNGGGNGGNGSGDLNVSGSVDLNVSGSVDINVSISGGGSGNGGGNKGGNGNTSLNESDTNILNDNLDDATEKSIGIRNFLEEFFSFLPPELLSLLAILFTVVIIKVIFNRK